MSDVEVLYSHSMDYRQLRFFFLFFFRGVVYVRWRGWNWRRRRQVGGGTTFMPSSEKQGGTAELSSSASERRMGNFSTADMGISPL